jgi:hypothetical protein
MEIDVDEDYTMNPIHSPVKKKHNSTIKKSAKGKKQRKKATHVPKFPRRNSTRETKKSNSKSEAVFRGTGVVSDDKDYLSADPDQIPNLPETKDSYSTDDEVHSSRLSSRHQIKLRKPQVAIDLNQPTPVEEFPEFKFKVRSEKDNIKKLHEILWFFFTCFSI